ncbi:hypothetical protein [Deinococcus arenicola]|uniref:Lipoprotein n=1 Tax=Deinococcus arenicola TaxID=2994950 RepID=A0ABU4DQD2_9DEIO|nr:hypothetical protein [Deinococcus sp. ZS9-10]MDV6374642.1 hypothetical protein [Deinococcus sp. ZS9-10]
MKCPGVVWVGLTLGSLGLAGCGSLKSAPTPLAGDLLSAPTTLNLGGQVLQMTAAPQVVRSLDRFSVRLRVDAGTAAARPSALAAQPRPLKITGIYVVTGSGLWEAPRLNDFSKAQNCLAQLCAWGSGDARDFTAGDDVRVIARLQDAGGKQYWLRDSYSRDIVPLPLIR